MCVCEREKGWLREFGVVCESLVEPGLVIGPKWDRFLVV